jgi:thymidylate synthase ThyX
MEQFTEEEAKVLQNFTTNIDKPVFVLKNLPEVVKGALFSRYSRSPKSLRRVLLDEFINKPESGFMEIVGFQSDHGVQDTVAIQKAEDFYDRVLIEYGDDSVAELGGGHVACEDVSQLAAKILEDPRVGISPLEKSTRYIYFNEKVNGEYMFYKEPALMNSEFSDLYVKTNNMLFDNYSNLINKMKKFVTEEFPQGDMSDRAYKFTIKAKACDILRNFLPASAMTNVGLFGNGRSFEYLLIRLRSSELQEMRDIAKNMHEELRKVMPPFVKRVYSEHGDMWVNYFKETNASMEKRVKSIMGEESGKMEEVELINYDEKGSDKVVEAILYQYSEAPFNRIKKKVKEMSSEQKKEIIQDYLKRRKNRRHKPYRAFEMSYYTFDILGNYGIYRDLQRHRILTQMRQMLSAKNGYDTPPELEKAGFSGKYHEAMQQAKEAFEEMVKKFPQQAQYIVPFGYKIRWFFTVNARQLYNTVELRTVKQGHPDYRRICQKMYYLMKQVHPELAEGMNFADLNTYEMQRDEAEKKIDHKLEKLKKK